jgi:hypothetical protein
VSTSHIAFHVANAITIPTVNATKQLMPTAGIMYLSNTVYLTQFEVGKLNLLTLRPAQYTHLAIKAIHRLRPSNNKPHRSELKDKALHAAVNGSEDYCMHGISPLLSVYISTDNEEVKPEVALTVTVLVNSNVTKFT